MSDAEEYQFNTRSRAHVRQPPAWSRLAFVESRLSQAISAAIGWLGVRPGDRVLDFGCADCPYHASLPPDVDYLPADLKGNPAALVEIGADGRVTLDDASVDAVLSTQVLEHVLDPAAYLAEAYRVLRPGGQLLLSTHGIMLYHPDPVDLWRWTGAGLVHQVAGAGFRIDRHEGIVGLAATGLQLFQDAAWGALPRFLRPPFSLVMHGLMAISDRCQSPQSRRMNALVFLVLARKPA